MKIVVLTKNYGAGFTGATTSTNELIRVWQNKGISIEVYTNNIVGTTNENVNIKKLSFSSLLKLKRESTNIVGYSDDHFGWLFWLFRIPYIHTYHGNWPEVMTLSLKMFLKSFYFIPQYGVTFFGARKVGLVSNKTKKFVEKFNKNTLLARNGVDVVPKEYDGEKKIGASSTLNVIMVGNIDMRKYSDAILIFEKMSQSVKQTVNFSIYGKIIDEKLALKIKEFPFVEICGFHQKIPYSKYQLLLSTSKSENLSIAQTEAIVSGVPVLAYDVGGTSELVKLNQTGWLIPKGRYDLMIDKMNDVASQEHIKFNNKRIIDEFNWEQTGEKYLNTMNFVGK